MNASFPRLEAGPLSRLPRDTPAAAAALTSRLTRLQARPQRARTALPSSFDAVAGPTTSLPSTPSPASLQSTPKASRLPRGQPTSRQRGMLDSIAS